MNKLFVGVAVLLAVAFAPLKSEAQNYPPTDFTSPQYSPGSITLFSNVLAASAIYTNALAKRPIAVPASSIMALGVTAIGAGTGTSNTTVYFNASLDGVNWTTTFPYSATFASVGTPAHRSIVPVGTNFAARFLSPDKITTESLGVILLSNVTVTFFPSR